MTRKSGILPIKIALKFMAEEEREKFLNYPQKVGKQQKAEGKLFPAQRF